MYNNFKVNPNLTIPHNISDLAEMNMMDYSFFKLGSKFR